MRAILSIAVCLAAAWPAAPCGAADPSRADGNLIQAHVAFLADDLLEGREAGSRGYDIAARYVASQLMQAGARPGGDKNGSGFLQCLPIRSSVLADTAPTLALHGKEGVDTLAFLEDFSVNPSFTQDDSMLAAPLVYAGFGIVAPRFGLDDYRDRDVKGKVVVLLNGAPTGLPSEEAAHLSRPDLKRQLAAERGAVGILSLQTPQGDRQFPFAMGRLFRNTPSMAWLHPDGSPAHDTPGLDHGVRLSVAASTKLAGRAGTTLERMMEAANAKQAPAALDFGVEMRLTRHSTRAALSSCNVVGVVEGSDDKLKHEYVVFSAHLDHLGIAKGKSGDAIFNGAMDNASGVAVLLEAARLVAQLKERPKRSIIYLAVTGEEKGFLGSEYFAMHPTVPRAAIVANVNLDMPVLTYDFKDVIAFGSEHSTLEPIVKRALAGLDIALTPDPWPAMRLFTRSDHYMFVRQGIPSIFLVTGLHSRKPGEDGDKQREDFMKRHYHRVSDDLSLPFNWDAAARFAQVNFNIGVEIANAPERPKWRPGNFFGDTFAK